MQTHSQSDNFTRSAMTGAFDLVPMPPVSGGEGVVGLSYIFALCGVGVAK